MSINRDLANIISGGFTSADIPNLDASKITSGTIADARLDLTNLSASNLTSGTIPTARISSLPAGVGGKIGQVLQTVKTDTTSTNNVNSFTDISGLSQSITPTSNSSKILVTIDMALSTFGETGSTGQNIAWQIVRDSTAIYIGDAASNRTRATASIRVIGNEKDDSKRCGSVFLDSPNTTSATTYKVQWSKTYLQGADYAIYLNRSFGDDDSDDRVRYASSITLMEVLS
tara:strand:+ start:106 stop:795 length:690 start_codon:yes stop_codon:yes gene_type:complete